VPRSAGRRLGPLRFSGLLGGEGVRFSWSQGRCFLWGCSVGVSLGVLVRGGWCVLFLIVCGILGGFRLPVSWYELLVS